MISDDLNKQRQRRESEYGAVGVGGGDRQTDREGSEKGRETDTHRGKQTENGERRRERKRQTHID